MNALISKQSDEAMINVFHIISYITEVLLITVSNEPNDIKTADDITKTGQNITEKFTNL